MANNQYVNKVQYGGNTLIDLTSDTVVADKILSGYTAHDKSGATITGTITTKTANDIYIDYSSTQGYQLVGLHLSAGYYATDAALYTSSVHMQIPQSGSHKFTIYIPNGTLNPSEANDDDWIELNIEVDSNGNSNITDDTIVATGVSF